MSVWPGVCKTPSHLCTSQVDESGRYTGEFTTIAISGAVRQRGESDACINRLMHENGFLSFSK